MTSPGRTSIGFLLRLGGGANGESFGPKLGDEGGGSGSDGAGGGVVSDASAGAGLSSDGDGCVASAASVTVSAATTSSPVPSGDRIRKGVESYFNEAMRDLRFRGWPEMLR